MAHGAKRQVATNNAKESSARTQVLALEIRASRFGYAAIERTQVLVDWGNCWFTVEPWLVTRTVKLRIRRLLCRHLPVVVVARTKNYHTADLQRRFQVVVQVIRSEAKRHHAKFTLLTSDQIRKALSIEGSESKYDAARRVIEHFPELSWKLPRRRRSYETELPRMAIFDAVAIGLAFLERARKRSEHFQVRPF